MNQATDKNEHGAQRRQSRFMKPIT